MKNMDVEVLSREMIQPSSPTPQHLRHYQLSFLDQIQPPIFMPLVMFYPAEHGVNNSERCNKIKQSLSEALTVYYPLAGRIKDNAFIDCNDEGVLFVEAKANNCHLSEMLENPNPNNHNEFIPLELDDANELPVMVQVTYLNCGGLVVFFGLSHKVGDALSFFMFLNCWAAFARGETDDIITPRFNGATLFPPRDVSGFQTRTGIVKENLVVKRFVFDASEIAEIRAKYIDNNDSRRPTRVEALSAFIWSRFMATTQQKTDLEKMYTVIQAMNLRTRMDPPLPNHYFGNISRPAIAMPLMDKGDGFYDILNQMREAVRKINGEYVKQLQETDKHLNFIKSRAASVMKGEVVGFSFTSLCRFPVYVADFGWGKPVWLGSARLTFKNLCSFFDTKYGDGIEVFLNMKEEDMAKLEADEEFLSYVSKNTSVKVSEF